MKNTLCWRQEARVGFAGDDDAFETARLVDNSYRSVRVVGRGTIKIDPQEVRRSPEFQAALRQAGAIVDE